MEQARTRSIDDVGRRCAGSDKQGRRRGGDAATTGRRMRRKDLSTFSATGLSECSSGKLLLVDCLNEDDHGRVPRVHDRSRHP